MSNLTPPPLPPIKPAASQAKVLRKLFLTLFLRGRSSRGLKKEGAPASIGSKLTLTLVFYAAFGLMAFAFANQSLFALSLYLHGATTVFLGMFVAASAGEVLFNKEEADILMHRPVNAKVLLWAKIQVMVQVALWLAGAFNICGFIVGATAAHGSWLFVFSHALSLTLEALFVTGCIVLTYQLCLRWFGRERLDNLMTTVQVFAAIAMVMGGQLVPQLFRFIKPGSEASLHVWWAYLLPPAWFAGLDDAVAGQGNVFSWTLAGCGVLITAIVLWLAFDKLANSYEAGLQSISEAKPTREAGKQWLTQLLKLPPLSWWLKDPVARSSFRLTVAYLLRDRDTKLRIYPAIAPMLVVPLIFLSQGVMRGHGHEGNNFGIAFSGSYIGLIPLQALGLLQFSQNWQAADIFRLAPLAGPGQICHGTRRAVLFFLTLPVLLFFAVIALVISGSVTTLLLFLPGLIAMPLYTLFPQLGGKGVLLSRPIEGSKSTRQGLLTMGVMVLSMTLAGLSMWSTSGGWFWWLVLGEILLVTCVYTVLRRSVSLTRWEVED